MSLPLLVAATIVAVAFAFLLTTWWDRRFKLRNVPSPANPDLVWGHEKLEFEDDQGWQWRKWFNECGRAFKMKAAWGHEDILIMGDTVGLSHIYAKNTYNYAHSPVFRPLIIRLTGRGLIWVEGEKDHKRMRNLVAPAFSAENVRNMHPDIYTISNALRDRLVNEIQSKSASGNDATFNIIEYTALATMDIIGRVGFGHDFNSIGNAPDAVKITNIWRKQNEMGCEDGTFIAMLVLRLFPWITSLPIAALEAQSVVANTIRSLAKDIVGNSQIDEKGTGKDLMSLMLKANARQDPAKRCETAEIYEHIVTFVVAGHETTASTLAFTMWALGRNPEVQNKLREELSSIVGEPTYDDFNDPERLPYLDAVCREALRLFPPSARNEKVAEEDDVIPLHTPVRGANGAWIKSIPVKAGQVIHIPSIGINRDQAVWGPDADDFRPTRWLVSRNGTGPTGQAIYDKYCTPGERGLLPSEDMCGGWSNLFTFSEGPRICVGMRLALFEYKAILTTLTRTFQFHDTGAEITTRHGATLSPRIKGRETEGINLPVRLSVI